MATDRSLRYVQVLGDLVRRELLPVGENDDCPLAQAEPLDRSEHLGSILGRVGNAAGGRFQFVGPAPLPGAMDTKPGSASRPFFGVEPVILRDDNSECNVNEGGKLCIKKPWPGMMRTMWGDHERFVDVYFTMYNDVYFTGDGCRIDGDGDYWLMGRIDDVVNMTCYLASDRADYMTGQAINITGGREMH